MGPLDVFWHLANLLLPAFGLGLVAPLLTKWVWRRELAAVGFFRLALPACAACGAVLLAGLLAFGRDGAMATYAGMVTACALALWWRGFGPGAGRGVKR